LEGDINGHLKVLLRI